MALKPSLKCQNEPSVALMGYHVACRPEKATKPNTKAQLLPPEESIWFLHSPWSHTPWIFSRGEKKKKSFEHFFFFFLDIKHFQSSWICRRVSEKLHQHVPRGTSDSTYLVFLLTEDCLRRCQQHFPSHPAPWCDCPVNWRVFLSSAASKLKDLPTWMFQKPAACFKTIPRRLKINRHCDKDGCSSRLPSLWNLNVQWFCTWFQIASEW